VALGLARQKSDLLLLASLFLLEFSIAFMAMALHMKGERPFAVFLSSKPGMVFLMMMSAVLIAGSVVIYQYVANRQSRSSHFRLVVAMNFVTLVLILITGEIVTRILSRSSIEGETLGNRVLLPKSWHALTLYNQKILRKASASPTFYVYDNALGWTIGPDRKSADGLYYSSAEGLRAPHEGISFAKTTKKTRIALVGDSYTFGEDVLYADTWGRLLEKALGPEFEVLNFGVPGYGLDQAYLRYEKDVREWKPNVVILSFIPHDTERSMIVYPALNYPTWEVPFSKPRLILRDGELKKLNTPTVTPEAIFSKEAVFDLPFLEYDRGFRKHEWEEKLFHLSCLTRAFITWFPSWEPVRPDVSDEALTSVNAWILRAFVGSVERMGSAPLVVYHPKRALDPISDRSLSRRVLREAGVRYTEPTSCLLELPSADWFIPQGHYTPQGNAAVAKCLVNIVRQVLTQSAAAKTHIPKHMPYSQSFLRDEPDSMRVLTRSKIWNNRH
jgi:hypothetical protein